MLPAAELLFSFSIACTERSRSIALFNARIFIELFLPTSKSNCT